MEGIQLEFEPDALDYIVDQSMVFKLGARGLRSICESIITDAMFELPSQTNVKDFTISLEYAQEKFEKSKLSKWRAVA
jgi:ATP-dependent Clp protease ATP-binding subunit ClpX